MKIPALLVAALTLSTATPLFAALKTEVIAYEQGGVTLEGYLAYDDASRKPQPGVLLIHDWMGVGDYAKSRARQLAELGYVAFAADIYGKGNQPADQKAAGALAGKYKGDRALYRARLKAGYDQLAARKEVASGQIAAIGYCFGGTGVLELVRGGAKVKGVVSFHGGLSTPTPEDAKNIMCPVLVLHGADDPFVKPAEVAAFKEEMEKAHVKYEFVAYPGAVHSFTRPDAGNDNSKGAAYNEAADKQSWAAMQKFFHQIFGGA
jgi:dienelactone hydrolase